MSITSKYIELERRKLLERIYSEMDESDRRMLVILYQQERMGNQLARIEESIEKNRFSFTADFLSNIAGNAAFDSFVYIVSWLIKRIRL